ncbi:hypothetical protein B0H14DRAFT_2591508 [Mycena olivaceomarginata]|nr:hypothetical protein B0H14DRAFT_2591508 [Mycena olivaceomarginata]
MHKGTAPSFFLVNSTPRPAKVFPARPRPPRRIFRAPKPLCCCISAVPKIPAPQLYRISAFHNVFPSILPVFFRPRRHASSNQTPRTSACGLPLPLPTDFDFRSYRKTPAELVAPDDMSLYEKNADNCLLDRANDASLCLTRAYEAATRSPAGVGDLDVGARLQPFFSYLEEEKALLIASKDILDVSGPLPLYMTMWIAGQHVLAAKGEAEEKKKGPETVPGLSSAEDLSSPALADQ